MKSTDAIAILEDMRIKLKSVTPKTCESWKVSLTSYIIVFFGKDAPQYRFVIHREFAHFGLGDVSGQVEESKPGFDAFIVECIQNIENYGIKKKEWKHILITTNPALFWAIFTTIVLVAFWLGTQLAANKGGQTTSQPTKYQNDSSQKK